MDDLVGMELFREAPRSDLVGLAETLTCQRYAAGEVIFGQGDIGDSFVLVTGGLASVSATFGATRLELGNAEPGSILGELSAITGDARRATVVAVTPVTAATGGHDAFDRLLRVPGVRAKLSDMAARRLAESARMVPVVLADGTDAVIRPLLARDRTEFESTLLHQPEEWLYQRFFSGGRPSPAIVHYLSQIDYLMHFAWIVAIQDPPEGIAVGRFIRSAEQPSTAEVAFEVRDDWRRQGLGTLLLGAVAVAAERAGLAALRAETLSDNLAMQHTARRAGAKWTRTDGGVLETTLPVADAAALLVPELRVQLGDVAEAIVTGAGLALFSSV
ncbi:MAG: GNAT family N-acetyltransferase [Acidimicrobiia bacterium]|nr:GNAT family N-acetyltransferase [Acidimicrobiia bacterium]